MCIKDLWLCCDTCEAPRSKVIMLLRRQAMKHRPRFRKQLKVGGERLYWSKTATLLEVSASTCLQTTPIRWGTMVTSQSPLPNVYSHTWSQRQDSANLVRLRRWGKSTANFSFICLPTTYLRYLSTVMLMLEVKCAPPPQNHRCQITRDMGTASL